MTHPARAALRCPVCSGTAFRREHTRLPGKQVLNRFKATMMICEQCSHTLFFDGWDDEEPSAGLGVLGAS